MKKVKVYVREVFWKVVEIDDPYSLVAFDILDNSSSSLADEDKINIYHITEPIKTKNIIDKWDYRRTEYYANIEDKNVVIYDSNSLIKIKSYSSTLKKTMGPITSRFDILDIREEE